MKIFYKNTPFNLIKEKNQIESGLFDEIYDLRDKSPDINELNGHVLIKKLNYVYLNQLLSDLTIHANPDIKSITCSIRAFRDFKSWIKNQYTLIEAAGGLVYNSNKVLMIYRHNIWDLPKGKLENKEKPVEGAKREVEEECNIKVVPQDKICHTWHTYTQDNQHILKKTYWYRMMCRNDSEMKPQTEEDITDIQWMDLENAKEVILNSYASIAYVFEKFEDMDF